jgi:hypothetical protein
MNNDAQQRPLLDHIEARDYQDRQDELSRHARLKTTEAALRNLGIDKESACGRLMRLVVRIAGLGVLMRSNVELAHEIETSHVRVAQRAAAGLECAGLLRRGVLRGANGRSVGVALQADWSRIVELSEATSVVMWSDSFSHPPHGRVEHSEGRVTTPLTTTTTGVTTPTTTTPLTPTTTTPLTDTTTGVTTKVTTTPMTDTTTNPLTNRDHTIYPLSLSQDPSSSSSQTRYVDSSDDDDDEGSGIDLAEIGSAAVRLREVASVRSRQRAEAAREDLWLAAFIGLSLEGRSIIERWARAASRVHPDDYPDYFHSCARKLCEEHGVDRLALRSMCPPCPQRKPVMA